ncbi:MAG: DUF3108 domain-containing protein [Pseudomonadota bacterium]
MVAKLKPITRSARAWRRGAGWCAVVLAVAGLHSWLGNRLADAWVGWGAAHRPPQRLDVAFVRELRPSTPPVAVHKPKPAPRPRQAPVQAALPAAASAPEPAVVAEAASQAPVPAEAVTEAASKPENAFAAAASAAAEPAPAASQPANVAYEWPPSSQLRYAVTGNYRGPVEGSARVQWIRTGSRYQVQMDTWVALVATRKVTSDGELSELGLRPRRFHEETQFLLGTSRHVLVRFEDTYIVLNNGRAVPRPPGVQDGASQLVQLVWLFTMRPELLTPGQRIELPIALPWRVDPWVFDVLEPQTVQTPFGAVDTVHVKPRRPSGPGDVLTVEGWFAPGLQYLPARLRIERDAQTYLDLLLESPPLQADEP